MDSNGRQTIHRVLKSRKAPPAPERQTDTTWRQLLRTQASTMLAVDFFHVDCVFSLAFNRPSTDATSDLHKPDERTDHAHLCGHEREFMPTHPN
ncbi:hypothetical protein ACFWVU_00310 [Streptomyces sp. NPDC058686]|uniref:hypothetical protein n=1 Tax=Streptomyces sp. NPDC058686 TaxID=3346599 RepID=UPI00366767E5